MQQRYGQDPQRHLAVTDIVCAARLIQSQVHNCQVLITYYH